MPISDMGCGLTPCSAGPLLVVCRTKGCHFSKRKPWHQKGSECLLHKRRRPASVNSTKRHRPRKRRLRLRQAMTLSVPVIPLIAPIRVAKISPTLRKHLLIPTVISGPQKMEHTLGFGRPKTFMSWCDHTSIGPFGLSEWLPVCVQSRHYCSDQ